MIHDTIYGIQHTQDTGYRIQDTVIRIQIKEYSYLDTRYNIRDTAYTGYRIQDTVIRIQIIEYSYLDT